MATVSVLDEASHRRDRVADALRKLGHTIRTAAHGVGGFKVLVQKGADLLLLGNELPRLHRMRFIDLIRCIPEWKNLPTILLTADRSICEMIGRVESGLHQKWNRP